MRFIIRILLTALAAYLLAMWLSPHVIMSNYGHAILFVIVLGILNTILKPVLQILTLPITILTLGLFLIVLNVLMVLLADKLVAGVAIENFWYALLFGILLSILSSFIQRIINK